MINWLLSSNGKYLYCEDNPTIRADLAGNVYSGGCFGSPEIPEVKVPEAPELPTAEELYQEALALAQREFPLALGAREEALSDIATPEAATEYYSSFQPTGFEEALANQYFENVWPETQKTIMDALSKSGMAYSPILAEQLGKARGQLGYDIGSYLSDLANTRATNILGYKTGLDPYSLLNPYVGTGVTQSQAQGEMDYQTGLAQAQSDYVNAMNEYNKRMEFAKTMGLLTGPIGAWAYGGPEAGMGSILDLGQIALGAATGGALMGPLGIPIGMAGGLQGAMGRTPGISTANYMPFDDYQNQYAGQMGSPYGMYPYNNTKYPSTLKTQKRTAIPVTYSSSVFGY